MSRVSSRFRAPAVPGTAAGVNLYIISRPRPSRALFAKRRADSSPPTREVIRETAIGTIVTPAAIRRHWAETGPECGRPQFHTEVICGN